MYNFVYISNSSKILSVGINYYIIDEKISECNKLIKNINDFILENELVEISIDIGTLYSSDIVADKKLEIFNMQIPTNIEILVCATKEYIYFFKIQNQSFKIQKKIPNLDSQLRVINNNLILYSGRDLYIIDYSLKIYKFTDVDEYRIVDSIIYLVLDIYDYCTVTIDLNNMIPKIINYIDENNIINFSYGFYTNEINLEYNSEQYISGYFSNLGFYKTLKKKDFYNVIDGYLVFSNISIKIVNKTSKEGNYHDSIIVQGVNLKLNKVI